MKVTITKKTNHFDFPRLLENVKTGTIILATGWQDPYKNSYKGICLRCSGTKHDLWGEIYLAAEPLTIFQGVVTIEQ